MDSLFFPQLESGAIAQFALKKTRHSRTVKNVMADGSVVTYIDRGGSKVRWDLQFTGLSTNEVNALKSLFEATSGRLRPFTFLDPTDNLLANSGNFQEASWQGDPSLKIVAGMADPSGSAGAFQITNDGATQADISQSAAAPAKFVYCFSIYVKAEVPGRIVLVRKGPTSEQVVVCPIGMDWNRVSTNSSSQDNGSPVAFAIRIDAGQRVTVFGPQLEAQRAPTPYKETTGAGGVYPNTYLCSDDFGISAEGPALFSANVSIESLA